MHAIFEWARNGFIDENIWTVSGPQISATGLACPETLASMLSLMQSFYTDHNGMKEDYFRLWDKLSSHYSNNPGVLGFDLFNEPL